MNEVYTTGDELKFLKNLGKGVHQDIPTASRLRLLMGYSRGIKLRVDWDKIDDTKITRYVKDAIEREKQKCIQ